MLGLTLSSSSSYIPSGNCEEDQTIQFDYSPNTLPEPWLLYDDSA
jgi:hypothetical protein